MLKWLGLRSDLVRSSLSLGAIFSASDSVAALQVRGLLGLVDECTCGLLERHWRGGGIQMPTTQLYVLFISTKSCG